MSARRPPPVIVIVAGVSGSGKTTVGTRLASQCRWEFMDGDSLHPAANVAKMASGIPLTDTDRAPWLAAMAAWIGAQAESGESGVVACSALKRRYREPLLASSESVVMAFLLIDFEVAAARLARRPGHFFDPKLLSSQFATLEPPSADEGKVVPVPVRVLDEADDTVAEVTRLLGLAGAPA
ncbi:MAG TPA: gluconokinase [Streptosporangiaceae bacterium]|nr:gluconokinase [Streptosporangiaceae bacterium]